MSQDTRRDRRVKIVSLNVRYKSASVDEFIENHAHDVSRGGIYIKTANPFPSGTLLKFEIRLASDQAVIAGVGRVVWKRDTGQANGERPAGMGVKFIKIDEPSKAVIDRLVNTKRDAGRAFESELGEAAPSSAQAASPAAASSPPGVSGPSDARPPRRTSTNTAVAVPDPTSHKGTMMGLGLASRPSVPASAPARDARISDGPRTPPRPAVGGNGMFAKADAERETAPKQEPTVMKQAAELLEEALREAGGSLDEIGTNPLFSGTSSAASTPPASLHPASPQASRGSDAPAAAQSMPHAGGAVVREHEHDLQAVHEYEDAETRARPVEADYPTQEFRRVVPEPPRPSHEPSLARPERPAGLQAAARLGSDPPMMAAKKGGSAAFIIGFVGIAVIAGAGVMYRDRIFASAEPNVPAAAEGPGAQAPATTTPSTPGSTQEAPPNTPAGTAPAATLVEAPRVPGAEREAPGATGSAAEHTPRRETGAGGTPPWPAPHAAPKPGPSRAAPAVGTEAPHAAPKAAVPSSHPKAPSEKSPVKPADDNPY